MVHKLHHGNLDGFSIHLPISAWESDWLTSCRAMSTAAHESYSSRETTNSAGISISRSSLDTDQLRTLFSSDLKRVEPDSPNVTKLEDGIKHEPCRNTSPELPADILEDASDWRQLGRRSITHSSTSAKSSASASKRPHSRASSGAAPVASKSNDAKFWFTKAKAVYSCRPYSPPKKQAATSPKKHRSASVASVWPLTELASGDNCEENHVEDHARRNSASSAQVYSYSVEGAPMGPTRAAELGAEAANDPEEHPPFELARAQLDRSRVDENELVGAGYPSGKEDSQANARRSFSTFKHDSQIEHGGSSQTEASEVPFVTRRESGKSASTSSPSPPPRCRSVVSKSASSRSLPITRDGEIIHIKDGESLLEDLSQVIRTHWGDSGVFVDSGVNDRSGGEQVEGMKIPRRRKTWSAQQLQRSASVGTFADVLSVRRGRPRSSKGSPIGKTGAHRQRSYRSSEKKGTVDGLREDASRTSFVSKAAYEVQLSAEKSVRAWAAENRPPRKGVELAIKAAADMNMNLANNFERVKNKAKQLDAQLARLTEVSANLDRSLSTHEELTRGDQEALQRLNDVMEITAAEGLTTRKYEHILTRVREELCDLRGSVDVITRETQAAEKARVAVTQRQDHARAESAAAREARVRARCEMGGLHSAWHSQLDELKQENEQKEEVNRYIVRRERMRHRIMRELDRNPKTPLQAQPGEAAGAVLSATPVVWSKSPNSPPTLPCAVSDGAADVSLEQLTGLVGTRDVPRIISMYTERKEKGTKLAESKERAEEQLRRLKEEKASLEVALKQVVYLDCDQAAGAHAGLKSGIHKKEHRLRREQERTLASERDVSLLGTCLWQLLSKIPDATEALQSLPAAYIQESIDTPNPQTPAVVPRPHKAPSKGNADGKRRLKGGGWKGGSGMERLSYTSTGSVKLARISEAGSGGSADATSAKEGPIGSMTPEDQAQFAVEALEQVSTKVESWLTWESAFLQDSGLSGSSNASSFTSGNGNGGRPNGNGFPLDVEAYLEEPMVVGASTVGALAPIADVAEEACEGTDDVSRESADVGIVRDDVSTVREDVTLASPDDPQRRLAPAFVNLGGATTQSGTGTAPGRKRNGAEPDNERRRTETEAEWKRRVTARQRNATETERKRTETERQLVGTETERGPRASLESFQNFHRRSADARKREDRKSAERVARVRARAEDAVAAAAVQAVKDREENYRVNVGQEAFLDQQLSLEAILGWLHANRDNLRAHISELDYDMSGTISTDELLELFAKVKFEPTANELRVLLGKLDRDGSGSITIGEFLDSSDDEDNAAVFRQTTITSVLSREDIKARTAKMARNQQPTQRPPSLEGNNHLSPEQSQIVLQKLQAIHVSKDAALALTRGTTSSAHVTPRSNGSFSSRGDRGIKPGFMKRPGSSGGILKKGTGNGIGKGAQVVEITQRGGDSQRRGSESEKRRPDSAPNRGEERRSTLKDGLPEEKRKSRIAFVEGAAGNEGARRGGDLPSRPNSAAKGGFVGSMSLSRPLSASGYKQK